MDLPSRNDDETNEEHPGHEELPDQRSDVRPGAPVEENAGAVEEEHEPGEERSPHRCGAEGPELANSNGSTEKSAVERLTPIMSRNARAWSRRTGDHYAPDGPPDAKNTSIVMSSTISKNECSELART